MFCVWFQGEKLLGSLGGIFSRTWKPKKTRSITGPVITRGLLFFDKKEKSIFCLLLNFNSFIFFCLGDSPKRRVDHLQAREKLGLNRVPKPQSRAREPLPESADAYQKVEVWILSLHSSGVSKAVSFCLPRF